MKRALSVLLSLAMLLVLLPTVAAGDGTGPYTASLNGKCKDGTASVYVFVASETEETYNAFWLTLAYDDSVLEFVGADNATPGVARELKASARNGEVTVAGCGDDLSVGDGVVILQFAVKKDCLTQVQLTEAQISARSQARADAKPAKLDANKSVYTVASGYYTVELPEEAGIYGDAAVAAGGDYTFSADPHYDYTFDITVGGDPAEAQNNGDGSYTVKTVNGPLRITNVARTPKSYPVTVVGSGKADVTAGKLATYGKDFRFSVSRTDLTEYAVSAVVDGVRVELSRDGDSYTIAGKDVTGPVTITVAKVTEAGMTLVLFIGSGAADVDGGQEHTCRSGVAYSFTVKEEENCDYVVMVDGRTITGNNGTYTIPAELVTGSILTVSVTKTTRLSMDVQVTEYLSGRLWLVEASVSVPVGKTLVYKGIPMYYSSGRRAYMCVVDGAVTLDEARNAISTVTGQVETLVVDGDANGSGILDVNDAQMIYDMYMNVYALDELTQTMWLRADVNGDRSVNVQDVQYLLKLLVE